MRVVVTGASGNLGYALLRRLVHHPQVDHVIGIARRRPEPAALGDAVEWVVADVARDDLVPVLRRADAVVHLAWLVQPSHDPAELWRVNVVGSSRVVDAVARAGVPLLVHASSVGAYSAAPKDLAVDESWPTHGIPTLTYSWQKAYVERVLDGLQRSRPAPRVVRMRPALVFQRPAARDLLRQFAGPHVPTRLLRDRAVLPAVRRLLPAFQAVHADDVAAAFELALTRPVHGPFNLAAGPVLGRAGRPGGAADPALRRLAATLWHLRLLRLDPGWIDLLAAAPIMDTSRARDELGWRPVLTAEAALRELLDGLRAGAGGPTPPLLDGPLLRTDRSPGPLSARSGRAGGRGRSGDARSVATTGRPVGGAT